MHQVQWKFCDAEYFLFFVLLVLELEKIIPELQSIFWNDFS